MTAVLTVTLNPALDYSAEAERVRPTQKTRTGPPRWDPGGGGINAARVVTTMGGSAAAPASAAVSRMRHTPGRVSGIGTIGDLICPQRTLNA